MRQFLSKVIAGGLSAAVILLWWPHVFATEGTESWFVRGLAWTLLFETLLLALTPLETLLWQAPLLRALAERAHAAQTWLTEHPSLRLRLAASGALAACAVALPLGLIATSGGPVARPRAKVIKRVVVKRPVTVVKKVEVKRPVRVIKQVQVIRQPTVIERAPATPKKTPGKTAPPAEKTPTPDPSAEEPQAPVNPAP